MHTYIFLRCMIINCFLILAKSKSKKLYETNDQNHISLLSVLLASLGLNDLGLAPTRWFLVWDLVWFVGSLALLVCTHGRWRCDPQLIQALKAYVQPRNALSFAIFATIIVTGVGYRSWDSGTGVESVKLDSQIHCSPFRSLDLTFAGSLAILLLILI